MLLMVLLLLLRSISCIASDSSFSFNSGFNSANLYLDGVAHIQSNGLLGLFAADDLRYSEIAHAFYPTPLLFQNSSSNSSSVSSFSTHFIFQINPYPRARYCGGGMAFVVSPTRELPLSASEDLLGLFNDSNIGDPSNRIFAIELDTGQDSRFIDIDANHVGIDINTVNSRSATTARYWVPRLRRFRDVSLQSSRAMHLWIDYYGGANHTIVINLAPLDMGRPVQPLITDQFDLSGIINQTSYVGFSAAPCGDSTYILGWSFAINGEAPELSISRLPRVPREPSRFWLYFGPVLAIIPFLLLIAFYVRRKIIYSEVIEGWELEYISHRFKYKDLHIATKGFKETQVVGKGGFGKVYKGVLRGSNIEVAVKRISHESRQGIREFVAEIVSIGRLRHRNLAPLLGYCRRKKEFLLVYEYMPNGSLDKHIHGQSNTNLNWPQRFRVITGIAHGLLYLHEEWEQVVIHRDIKPSNVLLDGAWNARVGDFGLARLHDHGSDPSTTKVVGTIGYIAPEQHRTGKATTSSDVYGFGALLLEVATGRRPIESNFWLVDWVHSVWLESGIQDAIDPNLEGDFSKEEVEFVLKLGLWCCHVRPEIRPTMKDVVACLEEPSTLPEHLFSNRKEFLYYEGSDSAIDHSKVPSSVLQSSGPYSITNSLISTGR